MNVYSITETYPIGTKLRLKDDYPGTIHEVLGYEWFADHANIIFKDGTKLSMARLELITDAEKPSERFKVVVPHDNGHTDVLRKFCQSAYENVQLNFDSVEESKRCQQAICMLLSRKGIYNIRATRQKNVLQLIREKEKQHGNNKTA